MTACADEDAAVYWCVICGPCLRDLISENQHLTVHNDVPHPQDLTYDEEEFPQ